MQAALRVVQQVREHRETLVQTNGFKSCLDMVPRTRTDNTETQADSFVGAGMLLLPPHAANDTLRLRPANDRLLQAWNAPHRAS